GEVLPQHAAPGPGRVTPETPSTEPATRSSPALQTSALDQGDRRGLEPRPSRPRTRRRLHQRHATPETTSAATARSGFAPGRAGEIPPTAQPTEATRARDLAGPLQLLLQPLARQKKPRLHRTFRQAQQRCDLGDVVAFDAREHDYDSQLLRERI